MPSSHGSFLAGNYVDIRAKTDRADRHVLTPTFPLVTLLSCWHFEYGTRNFAVDETDEAATCEKQTQASTSAITAAASMEVCDQRRLFALIFSCIATVFTN